MRFLILTVIFVIVGCNSTPNRDDYAKHVNTIGKAFHGENKFTFSFVESDNIDLRGLHNRDDSTGASHILYLGGAGLVGMFAQIGTHAALINSSRNTKLAEEQERANNQVQPLIKLIEGLSIHSLLNESQVMFVQADEINQDTLFIKPIFFANEKMDQLFLKLIVWLPDESGRTKRLRYQNMIEVFSSTLTPEEQILLLDNDNDDIRHIMASQLNTAIHVLRSDLTGQYSQLNKPQRTFTILKSSKTKVVRGSIVDNKCGYQVVQDLHSWYIAFPAESEQTSNIVNSLDRC